MKLVIPIWQKALLYISNNPGLSITRISLDVDVTYSHIVTIIKQLEEKRILFRTYQDKRTASIYTTAYGKSVARKLALVIGVTR